MNTQTPNSQHGFSTIQLLITIAVVAIVSTFAFMGITSARAHIRRMNSARLFASYVERARADSVRRHAQGAQQASIQQVNTTTYAVTMDFNSSGTVTTQNFSTETGVTINMPRTVAFDWRGRIPVETSVGFTNKVVGVDWSNNVNITGSGDVTLDAEVFYDFRLPPVVFNGSGGTVIPDPTPTPDPSASPSPTPTPSSSPTPTPSSSPTPTPSSSPTPTPSSSPTPTPSSSPTPTPSPVQCSISASPSPMTIPKNTSGTVALHLNNFSGSTTITATPSNSGQIQVTPSSATVTGTGSVTFTITVKRQDSDYITFSSSCGSTQVNVAVP